MTGRKALLNGLLSTLVREWGFREVQAALAQLPDTEIRTNTGEFANVGLGGTPRPRKKAKLLASEQVARAQLPAAQDAALRELAMHFDRKQFLPSVADVREFLVMMGERPGAMKGRSEAFRLLLEALSNLSPERLERLANSALHSGPSQLGPLSDAISAAAASLPRRREP